MISFRDDILNLNGKDYKLDYRIYDVREYDDQVVVLFHPDEGLNVPGQFANLVSFTLDGQKKWAAEFPTADSVHVYCKIVSSTPLCVLSMASYSCEINLATGKVVKADFYK